MSMVIGQWSYVIGGGPLTPCRGATHNQFPLTPSGCATMGGNRMRFMRFIRLAPVVVVVAGCANNAATTTDTKAAGNQTAQAESPVERGKYLVTVGGCNDCHTPKKPGPNGPEPDMSRQLSGNPATDKLPPVPAGALPLGA